jgi:xylulose-5-phosphate/fructose-6-phosphate phosphoketolase
MKALKICKELVPELKIRYVNISELTSISLGDYLPEKSKRLTKAEINKYFTDEKPVVLSYHGYINDVEQILFPYTNSERFSLHGYSEEGSTTTPFDMTILNNVSRYHIAIDLIKQGALTNSHVAKNKDKFIKQLNAKIASHKKYIEENGDDPEDAKNLKW